MRNLPWRRMLMWGGLWVLLVIVVSTTAFMLEWIPQAASEHVGKAAGIGLVLIWGAIIARHRQS